MAKWANSIVLDSGPNYMIGLAATPSRIKQHLVKNFVIGHTYATVVSNSVGSADLADTDMVISSIGLHRRTTIAAKPGISATAATGAQPDLHLVIVDSVESSVLLVTDETSNEEIALAQVFNMPSWAYTVNQPD